MKRKYFLIIVLVCLVLFGMNASQVSAQKPPTTTSWYIYVTYNETDQMLNDWMYNAGYQAGQKDLNLGGVQNDFVILDFGQPWRYGFTQGTWSFNPTFGRFLSTTTIKEAVKQFALGYYHGTGSNIASQMRVAIGTNNYGYSTTYDHGKAWAQMVKDIGTWLQGNSAGRQVSVRGASDIETGYSPPSTAKAWVGGYLSSWTAPYYFYNYGGAGGCPQSGTTKTAKTCNNGWTQNDVEYVSWGAPASLPFPEIYATSGANAAQWQQISLYASLAYANRMNIAGPLSQNQACLQRGGCWGINNTADQAWIQLSSTLNSNAKTTQNLTWSSDIKWRK